MNSTSFLVDPSSLAFLAYQAYLPSLVVASYQAYPSLVVVMAYPSLVVASYHPSLAANTLVVVMASCRPSLVITLVTKASFVVITTS